MQKVALSHEREACALRMALWRSIDMRIRFRRPSLTGQLSLVTLATFTFLFALLNVLIWLPNQVIQDFVPEIVVISICFIVDSLEFPLGWVFLPGHRDHELSHFVVWVLAMVANAYLWGYGIAGVLALVRRIRDVPQRRRERSILAGLCPECLYDLRGSRGGVNCPECGAAMIAPADKEPAYKP
ncbi:MAG: hypothetical protein NTW19_04245 [Planctomycetota bacterium]|nr:hypothetical protein [Planctomycetota bacterium]